MNEKLGPKTPEVKKENEVGKVVRGFFGGDYGKFQNNVRMSLEKGEFIVGTGAFLRSVLGPAKTSQEDFRMCQKAIRMEISKIKREEKVIKKEEQELMSEVENYEGEKRDDSAMADDARERIRKDAEKKEREEREFYKELGSEYPGDSGT